MDLIDVLLRLLGAFYVFAGYVASRATLTGKIVDHAIAALESTRAPSGQTHRAIWLLAMALLVLAGGVALMLLLKLASWIFLACVLQQAAYFGILAPRYFDPAEAPDAQGRRQSRNAFMIYTLATALVLWAHASGRLYDGADIAAPLLAVAAGAVLAHLGYVAFNLTKVLRPPSGG